MMHTSCMSSMGKFVNSQITAEVIFPHNSVYNNNDIDSKVAIYPQRVYMILIFGNSCGSNPT